ncbi:MAG: EamA family transporter, partial [Planctomycetes bacterium]|nr:EamA family transporter [Planctomycetota bacterium]
MKIPGPVIAFLCLGLAAASQSGNIIRLGEAHPIALAAWRLLIAAVLLAPLAGKDLKHVFNLGNKDRFLLCLAGLALAA